MLVGELLTQAKNFFREDTSSIVGAYFDGDKIFLTRLTDSFETTEIFAEGSKPEQLAEKIFEACRQRGWQNSAFGFCLRDEDVIAYQSSANHLPAKEIPNYIKTWAVGQTNGKDAVFAFKPVDDGEVWMETVPRDTVEKICAAFEKFNLDLCALSAMPDEMLTKRNPLDMTKFIIDAVKNKNAPNLLARRSDWNVKKISAAVATIFFASVVAHSASIFFEWRAATNELDEAKISVDNLRDELALKKILDENIAALNQLNNLAAQVNATKNLNLLLGLGKISGGDVHLTNIRGEENLLEIEGVAETPDAVKNYLGRLKNFVPNIRLENSSESDDGEIKFTLRAQHTD